MGVTLPGEVSWLLNQLGFDWPNTDEGDIFAKGGDWQSFAGSAAQTASGSGDALAQVMGGNVGEAVDAFRRSMTEGEDPVQQVATSMAAGSAGVGACLYAMAGVVIALKVAVVVQLVILAAEIASAIAAAVPSAGTSLTLIPLFKIAAKLAIEFAINMVINQLMGG